MSAQAVYTFDDEEFFDEFYGEFDDSDYLPEDDGYGDYVEFIEAPPLHFPIRPGTVVLGLFTAIVLLLVSLLKFTSTLTYPEIANMTGGSKEETSQDILSLQSDSSSEDLTVLSTGCEISKKYPESILRWCGLITKYAEKRGLPADLIAALIWQESGGNPVAYSSSGAVGLMQVMPRDGLAASFMCVNGPCFSNRPTTEELKDPEFNISYGTKMLTNLLSKNGNYRDALKSYGPMDVGYYYADKVLGIFQKYGKQVQ